jgi:TPR repeat protein
VPEDRRRALHWLATLTQQGHVGAQAFLADLLWHGKIVAKDEKRALALITVATENAPPHERIWIEDIYQRIFCGTVAGVRQQVDGLVASYRQLYVPRSSPESSVLRSAPEVSPARSCGNGETLPRLQRDSSTRGAQQPATRQASPDGQPAPDGVMSVRGR